MSKPVRRLGKGLDALISSTAVAATVEAEDGMERPSARRVRGGSSFDARLVDVGVLSPNPLQPRSGFNKSTITELALSLNEQGMIQPIAVRERDGQLQIVAGERRWRAAKAAGMAKVPVVVREVDDRQMLEIALVENIHREDLNPIDRARAYRRFCDEFGMSAEQVAERVGEDRTTVANYLRLLELPVEIHDLIRDGRLSMGHARSLAGVVDSRVRRELAERVLVRGLSVRGLEEIIRRSKQSGDRDKEDSREAGPRRANVKDLEDRLSRATGTRVSIHEARKRGTGRIVIEYYSLDDFDRIAARLGVEEE